VALFPESVDLATLALRVFLGAIFIIHGFPKLFRAEARAQTIGFMKSVGIPPALTLAASLLEFFGGLGLLVGLLTEVAALLIALEMVGTTILSRAKMGKKLVLGYELDLAYLVGAVAVVLLGSGAWSLDRVLGIAVPPLWLAVAGGLAIAFAAIVVGLRIGIAKPAPQGGPRSGP